MPNCAAVTVTSTSSGACQSPNCAAVKIVISATTINGPMNGRKLKANAITPQASGCSTPNSAASPAVAEPVNRLATVRTPI